jgi:hypothetical protein
VASQLFALVGPIEKFSAPNAVFSAIITPCTNTSFVSSNVPVGNSAADLQRTLQRVVSQ